MSDFIEIKESSKSINANCIELSLGPQEDRYFASIFTFGGGIGVLAVSSNSGIVRCWLNANDTGRFMERKIPLVKNTEVVTVLTHKYPFFVGTCLAPILLFYLTA